MKYVHVGPAAAQGHVCAQRQQLLQEAHSHRGELDSVGPSLARIMEQCHVRSTHQVSASSQNLIVNDIDLVLVHSGEQLSDGGLRVKQNLLKGRVVGVKEGEGVVLGVGGWC